MSTPCAVVAFGAVSALGEDEAAVAPAAPGEPAPRAVQRDAELAAAGLLRPFCARAPIEVAEGEDRATALLVRAWDACVRELDRAMPGWRSLRVGVALGTSSGGMRAFESSADPPAPGTARETTYLAPVLAADLAARAGKDALAPAALVLGACASGTLAIGLARAWLATGACDLALAGGFDAVSVFVAAGFEALRATAGERGPMPFRTAREGLALGEGAAVLALVPEADAAARGVRARGIVTGFGATCDAAHLTAPDRLGSGLARAAAGALADAARADRASAGVALVSAHGTATPANDAAEALAIESVQSAREAVVHAFKGSVGHTLGAAGALETLAVLVALERRILPASAGEGATLEGVRVLERSEAGAPEAALKLSAAFGGANGALALARATGPLRTTPSASPRDVFVSRAVAITGDAVAERTTPSALARVTGQPEDRMARGDLLVRLSLAAVGELARRVGGLAGAGIIVGEGLATLDTNALFLARLRTAGASRAEPRRFPFTTPNAAAGECAIAFGLDGPAFAVGGGAHGGLEALAVAADLVRARHAERVVVVAVDEAGPASRAARSGSRPGAVALLVGEKAEPGSARLDACEVALGRRSGHPRLDHADAHRALLPLAAPPPKAPPATLAVTTDVGIVANARLFWL